MLRDMEIYQARSRLFCRFTILAVAALSSCVHCLRGSGTVISESRRVGAFHSLRIDGSADVVAVDPASLEAGDLRVETDDNLLEHVVTHVEDGTLVIDTSNHLCLKPSGPLTVYTSLDHLQSLRIDGSGSVTCTRTITCKELEVVIDGSGDVRLEALAVEDLVTKIDGSGDIEYGGEAQAHKILIDGSGDVDAFGLRATDCKVVIDGSGDVGLVVTGHLDVVIEGSGDVTYQGKPGTLNTHIRGSGDVIMR